jgi:predicted DNA repair protein MutK
VPPFVGVAVKVIAVPEHTLFALDAIATAGVTVVFTVIVTPLEVAVFAPKQELVEVKAQVTTSVFAKVVVVNVALFVPVFAPFTFH